MVSTGTGVVWAEQAFTVRTGAGRIGARAVDHVHGLAPDIGVGFVQGARLPLIDQVVSVFGVGVAPFVRHDIIGSHSVTVIRRRAIPVGVRAGNRGIIVDRPHLRACGIIGIAPEGVEEVVVGLAAEVDDVLLVLVQRTGEGITFLPDLVAGVLLEEAAEKGILYLRDAVDDLAVVGIDVDHLTYAAAIGHLRPRRPGNSVPGHPGSIHPGRHRELVQKRIARRKV